MASGTTTSSSSISNLTGFCVFAQARYGSNGDSSGASEYEVGGSSSSQSSGRMVWSGDISGGLDSGDIAVIFTAEAGGGSAGVKWTVAAGSPGQLTYTSRTYGAIEKVQIRALVQIAAEMHWASVAVKFYRNNHLTEAYSQSTGPEVSTTGASPGIAEQILEVTPQFTNNTKVVVSGTVRLVAAAGVVPDVDDIAGQIFLYAAGCTAV